MFGRTVALASCVLLAVMLAASVGCVPAGSPPSFLVVGAKYSFYFGDSSDRFNLIVKQDLGGGWIRGEHDDHQVLYVNLNNVHHVIPEK